MGHFGDCKAILFDFGGTLDSDGGHWLDRFFEIYKKCGFNISFSLLKDAFYYADEICCKDSKVNEFGFYSLLKYHVDLQFSKLGLNDDIKKKEIIEHFFEESKSYLKRNRNFLCELHKKFLLGVVSNFYGNVSIICKEMGLSRYLDIILDSEQIGIKKPDPRIFIKAVEALNLDIKDVVFVGDSYERDMIPCKRLGMKVVWIKGPKPRIPENPLPVDAEISNLTYLMRLL